MKIIFKYRLEVADSQEIKLAQGSVILSVQEQHNDIYLWAFVDTDKIPERRVIEMFGTGHELPENILQTHSYITSVQNRDQFVWHIFENKFPD